MSKQKSISSFFKQGGGDDEKRESERAKLKIEKRKSQQSAYDKSKRTRTVQESWLSEYEWATEEDGTLFCKVCRQFPLIADSKSSLYIGISSKFKKETLKFHAKSAKHIRCVEHKTAVEQPGSSAIEKSAKKVDEINSKKYEVLMNTAYYVAQEGEAFSKFPGLCDLMEKNGVTVGQNYRNRQACTGFVTGASDTLKAQTSQAVEKSRFVSILCDGATDKAIIEQEIIYIRYVDEHGKLCTKLADIVDLEKGDAQGVKTGVIQAVDSIGLTVETLSQKLVGINTDGASVNMGKKGGAIRLLMDEVNQHLTTACDPYMMVVHCIAHNLELAVCDTKKGCHYLARFEETLKGIFKFYYYSPKKRRELYEIAVVLDKEVKHYGGVQQVRWVASQQRALKSLLDNYEVTVVHLEEIASKRGEDAARAKGYIQELKTERYNNLIPAF